MEMDARSEVDPARGRAIHGGNKGWRVAMKTSLVTVRSILSRSSGFLTTVCSHSLQPYRGCPFGKLHCGISCYVPHTPALAGDDRPWGSFLDVRTNAAESYHATFGRERDWAR